jgi:Amt family ammonium transporter
VHAACGIWGVLWLGLVADRDLMVEVYGVASDTPFGVLHGGGGELFACQCIGVLVISAWTACTMTAFFSAVNALGLLRVTATQEDLGLDLSYHGGTAYEEIFLSGLSSGHRACEEPRGRAPQGEQPVAGA